MRVLVGGGASCPFTGEGSIKAKLYPASRCQSAASVRNPVNRRINERRQLAPNTPLPFFIYNIKSGERCYLTRRFPIATAKPVLSVCRRWHRTSGIIPTHPPGIMND